jgi:hypothetical protein
MLGSRRPGKTTIHFNGTLERRQRKRDEMIFLIQLIMRPSDVDTNCRCCIKIRDNTVTAGLAQLGAALRRVEALRLESESQKTEKAQTRVSEAYFLNHPRINISGSTRNG